MRIRRDPDDDYLHRVDEAGNYNESRYYNFCDAASGLGGFVRMGNRRARYGDDRTVPVRHVEMSSDYDAGGYHRAVHARVATDDHTYALEGDVWSNIPLRNRRNGLMTRITEGITRWSCDGAEGAGLAEYLDQIVDGRPVGIAAGG